MFVLYMTAGLVSKITNNSENDSATTPNDPFNTNNNKPSGFHEIGVATNWVNPFITRYRVTTSTIKPKTTTTVEIRDDPDESDDDEPTTKKKTTTNHHDNKTKSSTTKKPKKTKTTRTSRTKSTTNQRKHNNDTFKRSKILTTISTSK